MLAVNDEAGKSTSVSSAYELFERLRRRRSELAERVAAAETEERARELVVRDHRRRIALITRTARAPRFPSVVTKQKRRASRLRRQSVSVFQQKSNAKLSTHGLI